MAENDQLAFVFGDDDGPDAEQPLSRTLRLGRLRLAEELSLEQAVVAQAWQRVERAVSDFARMPAAPER